MATSPIASTEAPPTPRHDAALVPIPTDDATALRLAREIAAGVAEGAAERDRTGDVAWDEFERLRSSGLLTISVPRSDGGPGLSHVTIARIFAILAAADPAFVQVVQPHVAFVDNAARTGDTDQRALLLGEVLRGARFGNALSERGGKHAFDFTTRLTEGPDGGLRLDGAKYYSTGALRADWVAVLALDASNELVTVFVPSTAPGLHTDQDWSAFGQRTTLSGTTTLDAIHVRPEWVVRYPLEDDGVPTTLGAYPQLLHAAIDVGIARGALTDGIAFTRDHARPWPGAGVERAIDEPHTQALFGRLATLVEAAELSLDHAAGTMDHVATTRTVASVGDARLAIGRAKALAGEVALEVTTSIFDGSGSSGVDRKHALDRHWRNARTHTLHDPNRWKYISEGRRLLRDEYPPADDHSI